MSDKPIIIAGLAVFLALVTFPFWYVLVSAEEVPPPERSLPEDVARCVADALELVVNQPSGSRFVNGSLPT